MSKLKDFYIDELQENDDSQSHKQIELDKGLQNGNLQGNQQSINGAGANGDCEIFKESNAGFQF